MNNPTQWLITGGAGFIGKRLTQVLLQQNNRVRVIDNFSATDRNQYLAMFDCVELGRDQVSDEIQNSHELIVGDVNDADLAIQLSKGIDITVHLAANTGVQPSIKNPRLDFMSNCLGVFNYLEAARLRHNNRFVFASTGAVLGQVEPPFHEQLLTSPINPYGASKLAGEAYCAAYFKSFGVKAVALRFSNVYGPLSTHKDSIVAKFIRQIIRKEELLIYGDGKQTRDFIYVDDIVSAILAAGTNDEVGGEIFQIGTNIETTVNELCSQLFPILEAAKCPVTSLRYVEPRRGDGKRNYSLSKKAYEQLGWKSKVELNQGLRETVSWMLDANADASMMKLAQEEI